MDGDDKKFLCHRRSCLQPYDSAEFDRSKIPVPVVPATVMIRISGRPPYFPSEDEIAAADLPVWQAEDLRADILWRAHYCRTPHSRKAQTIERAMSVAWWPGIDTQAKMEYRLCSICNDIRLVLSGVGRGDRGRRHAYLTKVTPSASQHPDRLGFPHFRCCKSGTFADGGEGFSHLRRQDKHHHPSGCQSGFTVGFVRRSNRTQSRVTPFFAGLASSTPDKTCFTVQDYAAILAADIASDTVSHGEDSTPVSDPSEDEISAENAVLIRQLSRQDCTSHLRSM